MSFSTGSAWSASELVTRADKVPSVWAWGGRWSPLVSSDDAGGSYSILEQTMPAQAGPPPHVHEHNDEVFYILDGEVRLQIDHDVAIGTAGDLVRIPRGVPHGFAVKSDTARFLNLYVPGALDVVISALGTPAAGPGLPADGTERSPGPEQVAALGRRLEELAAQKWTGQQDLLAAFRPASGGLGVSGPDGR
ncbi:cupin domain-containing protein [Actinacidiphila sp. bgisy144]|uniref:cupin domain-containing protein n=1 Tax=Actinacidiphila sp. bgisy144 TaxID=3413791 RepID=UPI003EBBF896